MGRYDNDDYGSSNNMRQKDLVLSTNEFVFIQSKTNGQIKTYTGPIMATISAQESMVIFNPKTKRFEETGDFEKARQLFTSAPEGWYIVLKNPSKDNEHPEASKAVNIPELNIGKKINIAGPCSFSLFPGQMAKVIQGHKLRSNQYLMARVYDAEMAQKSVATIVDAEGKEVKTKENEYFVGQLLIIKGTEVSFYMPPTGIEVIPQTYGGNDYVRDAITLERLEYAILKDEDGEKRYVHGPAVVFPKPTETFVKAPKGGTIFRALELSPISGIYIKVIAEYEDKDKNGKSVKHPIGEELFITGNEQMIYYPRPEHAMIQYDGKYMHHAIAIPEGEGRYILDRLTGKIKTVVGPQMYLPDPRKEVVVKRKLSKSECELYYPGNKEVLAYNMELSEKSAEAAARRGNTNSTDVINNAYATANQESALAIFEANSNISRGVSYTKPRTITLDTKYDGVVGISVWTGYAINVVSKNGKRETIVGPNVKLLDYDQSLEVIQSPINGLTQRTVFLKTSNNKVIDTIITETADYVQVAIDITYSVNFLDKYKDKWFSIDDYAKVLCDTQRSLLKRKIAEYSIEEFYANSNSIIREVCLTKTEESEGMLFEENGMFVYDVEVTNIKMEKTIADMISKHQENQIKNELELTEAKNQAEVIKQIEEFKRKEEILKQTTQKAKIQLENEIEITKLNNAEHKKELARQAEAAAKKAEKELQVMIDAIETAKLKRDKEADAARIEVETKIAEIEKAKQDAYAETVAKIMESITPELIAAMQTSSNAEMVKSLTENMSPYAIAEDTSVVDVTNKLLRGTGIDEFINTIKDVKNN